MLWYVVLVHKHEKEKDILIFNKEKGMAYTYISCLSC